MILSKRDLGLDALRGFAMLLVMYGHSVVFFNDDIQPAGGVMFGIFKFIYGFHMPLFFAISGYLFRPKSWRATSKNSLMLIFVAILVHALAYIGSAIYNGEFPYWKGLIKPMLTLQGLYTGVVWFLVVLAFVQLIAHALYVATGSSRLMILCAVALASWLGAGASIQVFNLGAWWPALMCFFLGRLFSHYPKFREKIAAPGPLAVFVLVSMAASLANNGCSFSFMRACENSPWGFVVYFYNAEFGNIVLIILSAAAGSLATIALADMFVAKLQPGAIFLAWVGQRTLDLLIINGFASWYVGAHIAKYFYSSSIVMDTGFAALFVVVQIAAFFVLVPITRTIKAVAEVASVALIKPPKSPLQ